MRFLPRRRRPHDEPEPLRSRQKAQQEYLRGAYPNLLPGPGGPDEPVAYFYQAGHLLVREEYLDQVRGVLRRLGRAPRDAELVEGEDGPATTRHSIAGVRLVRLTGEEQLLSTIDTLRLILHGTWPARYAGPRFRVEPLGAGALSLNHLVHIVGEAGGCPYNEPEPVAPKTLRWPGSTRDTFAGTGVRVVVLDTALNEATRDATPWLKGVRGVTEPNGTPPPPDADRYYGHGTFIAGVVRTMAPSADVVVRALFERRGAALEFELISALHTVLMEDDPDIISLSAGTYTFEGSGLLGLEAFHQSRLRHHKGVVLIAAAGNDNDRAPFWPAAAHFAVSVGALDRRLDGRVDYSNYGGWVDVYAAGTGLINAYPAGMYTYQEPPYDQLPEGQKRQEMFTGLARWSGTSFSTPLVAGLVAARMSHTGENGHDAAAALVHIAQQASLPGVGAVLMPR